MNNIKVTKVALTSNTYRVFLLGYSFKLVNTSHGIGKAHWVLENDKGVEVLVSDTKKGIIRVLDDAGIHYIDKLYKQEECNWA